MSSTEVHTNTQRGVLRAFSSVGATELASAATSQRAKVERSVTLLAPQAESRLHRPIGKAEERHGLRCSQHERVPGRHDEDIVLAELMGDAIDERFPFAFRQT